MLSVLYFIHESPRWNIEASFLLIAPNCVNRFFCPFFTGVCQDIFSCLMKQSSSSLLPLLLPSLLSAPFYKIMVPTVDTVRYNFLVQALVGSQYPVLLTGPVGTGKTSVAQGVLQALNPTKWTTLTVNMSSQVALRLHTGLAHLRHFTHRPGTRTSLHTG